MKDILQTFPNAFSVMKIIVFGLKFHCKNLTPCFSRKAVKFNQSLNQSVNQSLEIFPKHWDIKPLPEQMMTYAYDAIWHHWALCANLLFGYFWHNVHSSL